MKKPYQKRQIRTFRDLDVYQQTLEGSVIIAKNLRSKLVRLRYPYLDNMVDCALSIPLVIAEAHSVRFGNIARAISLLEHAMANCNKMVVYLEQVRGLYGDKMEYDLIEETTKRYSNVRVKILRLEKAWERFARNNPA